MYTSILRVPILPKHLSVGFRFYTILKVATFVGSVHHVTPYWELEADARCQRRKFLQLVVGTVLWGADIVVHNDNNSTMIHPSEMRELENDYVSEVVVQYFQMACDTSLSTCKMLKFERQ